MLAVAKVRPARRRRRTTLKPTGLMLLQGCIYNSLTKRGGSQSLRWVAWVSEWLTAVVDAARQVAGQGALCTAGANTMCVSGAPAVHMLQQPKRPVEVEPARAGA